MSGDDSLVSLAEIQQFHEQLMSSGHCIRTPLLTHVQRHYGIDDQIDLYLKLENLQVTGSFKIRGVYCLMKSLPEGCGTVHHQLITMSAGNFGKAYAYMAQALGLHAKVLLPVDAPKNRTNVIQGYGVEVERHLTSQLRSTIDRYVAAQNMYFVDPFHRTLIAGCGSTGLEILEDIPDPDIVLVCCGGGGILAGIATAIRLSGVTNCRIYGVEPQGSRTMHESFKVGHAVSMEVGSIAAGLSPPFAGESTYQHCKQHVDDILLVSEQEIISTTLHLFERGLKVEPSGVAAFAALQHKKVPDVQGKKVVVVVTGGNVTTEELVDLGKMTKKS